MMTVNNKITITKLTQIVLITFCIISTVSYAQVESLKELETRNFLVGTELYLFRDKNDPLIQKRPPIFKNHLASFEIYDENLKERQKNLSKDIVLQKDAGFYSFTILGEKKKISQETYDTLDVLNRKEFLEVFKSDTKVFIIEREGYEYYLYSVSPIRYK